MSSQNFVTQWLTSLGLERYAKNFSDAGIDSLYLVKQVRKKDLIKMHINAAFHQDLLLREAHKIDLQAIPLQIPQMLLHQFDEGFLVELKALEERSLRLVLPLDTTIDQLKVKIERDWLGIQPVYQTLLFQGERLDSGLLLDNESFSAAVSNSGQKSPIIFVLTQQPPAPLDSTPFTPPVFQTPSYFFQNLSPFAMSFDLSSLRSIDNICRRMDTLDIDENVNSILVQFIGDMNEIELEASPDELTIGELKSQLACIAGPPENLMISINCRISENDEATITSFNYKKGDRVYVINRYPNWNEFPPLNNDDICKDDVEIMITGEYETSPENLQDNDIHADFVKVPGGKSMDEDEDLKKFV